ncbi:MAG: 1,4-dihydroxy-2-naphthoate octaprenyltransferase [Bacteroidaceae bacterium]|nr:1,4-dihydroxy-2-naphthoate octaprenyltransferase [Bacteroidaceae bacterium]
MNPSRAWLLAIRPKTLTGALAPVCVALSAAWADGIFVWQPALLCALFALLMQIDANLANDYIDFRNGTDGEERLGPERACASGWITPRAMRRGIVIVTLLSCLVGLPLIYWGGWSMVIVGAVCVAGCFLYTTTFSRIALGDVLVVLFFGIVPICITYYLQTATITTSVLLASIAMGLVTDTLLIVNNYRDRDTDLRAGKRTLPNIIGAKATEWFYLIWGIVGVALVASQTLAPLLFLPVHLINWRRMYRIHEGRDLNISLAKAAQGILLFALLYATGMISHI